MRIIRVKSKFYFKNWGLLLDTFRKPLKLFFGVYQNGIFYREKGKITPGKNREKWLCPTKKFPWNAPAKEHVTITITLKCLPLLFTPVYVQGDQLGPIHFLVLSRRNFVTKSALHVYTPKVIIYQQKEQSKNVSFQNVGHKTNFCLAKKVTWPKFGGKKTLSQRNFSVKFGSKLKNINTIIFLK